MHWKWLLRDYLSFTRKDRIGLMVLILLIGLVFFLPEILTKPYRLKPGFADTSWVAAIRHLEKKQTVKEESRMNRGFDDYQHDRSVSGKQGRSRQELFFFDPNTISAADWKKLGVRDRTIRTIQNYLGKGGHFNKPEDLQKIYGLFPDEYERLAPYVKITGDKDQDTRYKDQEPRYMEQETRYKTERTGLNLSIEINSADTGAYVGLPGIGSKLAARIINFRDKLGGFYSIEQVGETFGLPDSTFKKIRQYLKLENAGIRKININTATVDELKGHPYIRWSIANAIIAFRTEHGSFIKMEDIKKLMLVTDEVYRKIEPYLTTQ